MPAASSKPNWQKLGVKPGETLHVVDAPADVDRSSLVSGAHAVRDGLPPGAWGPADVVLAFVTDAAAVAALAARIAERVNGRDVRLWAAYLKGVPKGAAGALSRDRGWEPLRALGLEGVSLVALDARWSALRLRDRAHTARRGRAIAPA